MADRETINMDRSGRLARLEAENARLRHRLAAELAANAGELEQGRDVRRRDGAVDPAHRLLVAASPLD
jgi:hypothetical protein